MSQMLIERIAYHGFNLNIAACGGKEPRLVHAAIRDALSKTTSFNLSPVERMLNNKALGEKEVAELPIPRLPYTKTWFEWADSLGGLSESGVKGGVLGLEDTRGTSTKMTWYLFVSSNITKPALVHVVGWDIEREDFTFGDLLKKTRQTSHGRGEEYDTLVATNMLVVVYALAMLGCKNVGTEDVEHDRRSVKEMNYRFGGKRNRITYKVLTVKVPRRGTVRLSDLTSESRMLPLHSVRGHFKEYTPDAPLLGRHIGRYWWHPHVRGTEEYGTVVKDYAVKVAKEVATVCP